MRSRPSTTPADPTDVRRILAFLLPILNAPFLIAVIIALLARFIVPGFLWWTAMFAILLPWLGIILLIPTFLLIIGRHWGWMSVNLVILVAAFAQILPGSWGKSTPDPQEDDLIIMTFSVPRYGPSAAELAANVTDLLAKEQPHVVALQETVAWRRSDSPGTARIADYVQAAQDSLGYILAIPSELAEARTRLPLLSLYGDGPIILDQEEGTLGDSDGTEPGRFVRTILRLGDRNFVLYNVHLSGYGPEKPWEEEGFPRLTPTRTRDYLRRYRQAFQNRSAEARQLREMLDNETLPIILVGDLNETPYNWAYRVISRGFTDVFDTVGSGGGGTYRGDKPFVRIDFVFTDSSFTAVQAHVPEVTFSDHRPVVARLRLR